jgi:hypothetical protein
MEFGPSAPQDTPACAVWHHGRFEQITSTQTCSALRAACASIGSAKLGFEPKGADTHLLRSGVAIEIYLAGVPVYTILLIGRWSSDAFLRYIWKQLEQFSKHVLKQIIQLLHAWSQTTTPGSATIVAMLRRDTILEATGPDRCNCRISLFSTDGLTMPEQLMEEASSNQSLKASGEGRVEYKKNQFQTQPPCAHLVHLHLIPVSVRRLALKLLC